MRLEMFGCVQQSDPLSGGQFKRKLPSKIESISIREKNSPCGADGHGNNW